MNTNRTTWPPIYEYFQACFLSKSSCIPLPMEGTVRFFLMSPKITQYNRVSKFPNSDSQLIFTKHFTIIDPKYFIRQYSLDFSNYCIQNFVEVKKLRTVWITLNFVESCGGQQKLRKMEKVASLVRMFIWSTYNKIKQL